VPCIIHVLVDIYSRSFSFTELSPVPSPVNLTYAPIHDGTHSTPLVFMTKLMVNHYLHPEKAVVVKVPLVRTVVAKKNLHAFLHARGEAWHGAVASAEFSAAATPAAGTPTEARAREAVSLLPPPVLKEA